MSILQFKPAVRRGSHVIITAYGESGCGKTLSLLRLGRGLVGPKGKLCMIDTETGRGMIYADAIPGGYDYAELTPPFTPERYIEALDAAEEAGYEACILDSGSHEWEGLGGVLEIADAADSKGLVKWAKPKARHKKYVQRLLRSRMHLLISLRAKEKMIQVGGAVPVPQGMKSGDIISGGFVPIQDKRFIFETTIQLFFPTGGERGVPSLRWPEFKCPRDLEGAFPANHQIDETTGSKIAEWVAGGTPVDHEFEALKLAAEEAAEGGTESFRKYWKTIPTQRARLSDLLPNLQSIAAAADRDKEQAQPPVPEAEPPAVEPVASGEAATLPQEETSQTSFEEDFGLEPINNEWREFQRNMVERYRNASSIDAIDKLDRDFAVELRQYQEVDPRGHGRLRSMIVGFKNGLAPSAS